MKILQIILCLAVLSLPTGLLAEAINAPLAPAPGQNTQTVQPPAADNTGAPELFDIKGPVEIPDNSTTILWSAAAALLLLLAILCFIWWKRTRKQRAILAHETALQRLAAARGLIDKRDVDAFVTLIDQTLRSYIEQRFAVSARRQTTREFISAITEGSTAVPEPLAQNKTRLQTWLEHCDMVKFAKANLSTEDMEKMLANLQAFIESTRMEGK